MPPTVYLFLIDKNYNELLGIEQHLIFGMSVSAFMAVDVDAARGSICRYHGEKPSVIALGPSLRFDAEGHYVSENQVNDFRAELDQMGISHNHLVLLDPGVSVERLRAAIEPVINKMSVEVASCL